MRKFVFATFVFIFPVFLAQLTSCTNNNVTTVNNYYLNPTATFTQIATITVTSTPTFTVTPIFTVGIIQVENYYSCNSNNSNYPVNVSLDNGNSVGTNLYNGLPGSSSGYLYTFPNTVIPGIHTLTFSVFTGASAVTCNGSSSWTYQPGSGATGGGSAGIPCTLTFNVANGQIFDAVVTEGSNNNAISITHY